MKLKLSICIPTYNRAFYLSECLESMCLSSALFKDMVEIIICDNASTDDTAIVVKKAQENFSFIRYHRNEKNIGGERNFRFIATLANGDYIWVFGDDDQMEENAISIILKHLLIRYDLLICNYSKWDKNISVLRKTQAFSFIKNIEIDDPNSILDIFNIHLGYISSIIIKRDIFLILPLNYYEKYIDYGFPFMLSVYVGFIKSKEDNRKALYIADPIFKNRGDNNENYNFLKYFAEGSALIFDDLKKWGYSSKAILRAKSHVISRSITPYAMRNKISLNDYIKLSKLYKNSKPFWFFLLPVIILPQSIRPLLRNIFKKMY